MSDDTPVRTARLTPPVDLRAALGSLGIEHLVVNRRRLFVIFRTAVLELRIWRGELASAGVVALAVLDGPARSTATETGLQDRLLERLAPAGTAQRSDDRH